MKKLILVFICFTTLLVGCKVEEEKKSVVIKPEPIKKTVRLKIKFNYNSSVKDKLECLFSQIDLDNNQNAYYVVNENISDESGDITFQMPGDDIPLVLILRLGATPKEIAITNMVLSYEDKEVIVDGHNLEKYFTFNEYITYDSENQTIKTNKINNKHYPQLTLRRNFINELFDI